MRLSRPHGNPALGAQPYSGLSQTSEEVVSAAVPAHVQPERQGAKPLPGLPADAEGQALWRIVLKLPKGAIRPRDVLTDDLGTRYQVVYAAWNPLSTSVLAAQLNGTGAPAGQPWEQLQTPWEQLNSPWQAFG